MPSVRSGADEDGTGPGDILGRLTALVLASDVAGATALVLGLDERSRAPLWRPIGALERPVYADLDHHEASRLWDGFLRAQHVVLQGCGTAEAAGAAREANHYLEDTEVVIRSRPRAWLDRWADLATRDPDGHASPFGWRLVRRLVAEGACTEPTHDDWTLGAIRGLIGGDDAWYGEGPPLLQNLREDPAFREGGLWRLFEVEGVGDASLSSVGNLRDHSWTEALTTLAADGTVDRGRLLDAALGALRRDFAPHHARWYRSLHDAMAPTLDERAGRQDEYHALCYAADPAVVRVGTRALLALAKGGRLDAGRALEALRAALSTRTMAPADEAVRTIELMLRDEPSLATAATAVLVDALLHASRDVQERAVTLLEPYRGALATADRERAEAYADEVDPAVRPRIRALVGDGSGGQAPVGEVTADPPLTVPPARVVRPSEHALRDEDRLRPVVDAEDLLKRLAVLIETGDDPDELELLLDGASRFSGRARDAGQAAGLVRRARTILGESASVWVDYSGARSLVAALALAWLRAGPQPQVGFLIEEDEDWRSHRLHAVPLGERVRAVLARVADGEAGPLLAAPTHRGGWIAPDAMAARLAARGVADDRRERELALLRLHPSATDELRAAVAPEEDPAARQLGPRDPETVADRVLASSWSWGRSSVEATDTAEHPTDWLTLGLAARQAGDEGVTHVERWLVTVSPADGEAVAAQGLARLLAGQEVVNHGVEDYLVPLLDERTPVGPIARLMLAAAASTSWPPARTIATDVLIQAVGDGRIDGEALAAALTRAAGSRRGCAVTRWAAVLGTVAGEGPLHAYHVQRAVEGFLGSQQLEIPPHPHGPVPGQLRVRDAGGIVDVLRRLATDADARVSDPAARAFLEQLPARTKVGRAAREALAVAGTGAARAAAAVAVASPVADGHGRRGAASHQGYPGGPPTGGATDTVGEATVTASSLGRRG